MSTHLETALRHAIQATLTDPLHRLIPFEPYLALIDLMTPKLHRRYHSLRPMAAIIHMLLWRHLGDQDISTMPDGIWWSLTQTAGFFSLDRHALSRWHGDLLRVFPRLEQYTRHCAAEHLLQFPVPRYQLQHGPVYPPPSQEPANVDPHPEPFMLQVVTAFASRSLPAEVQWYPFGLRTTVYDVTILRRRSHGQWAAFV